MARKPAMVLNREAMSAIDRAIAVGLEAVAEAVLDKARPPDATEGYMYRRGQERLARTAGSWLVENGGYISYLDGKKIGAKNVTAKPKQLKVRGKGAVVGVGFGFPARFIETGTVDQPPRPFLTPAVMEVVGNERVVATALSAALRDNLRRIEHRVATEAFRAERRARRQPKQSVEVFDFGKWMSGQKGFVG